MPKRRKENDGEDVGSSKMSRSKQSGRADGDAKNHNGNNSNTIPIFLKKTYRMIETCDPDICSWTSDGEMFVVKNPELFASEIIPQYFDHNKFSSFARQLNFYGFRKIQTKPIRNEDFDHSTAKHVTFFNEKFKQGRYDLLKEIQRSTRGGGAQASLADQAREVEALRGAVAALEQRVQDLESGWQEVGPRVEREIQAKVELAVMDLLSSMGRGGAAVPSSSHVTQFMPQLPASFGDTSILQRAERSFGSVGRNPHTGTWENPLLGPQAARTFSTASAGSAAALGGGGGSIGVAGGGGPGGDGQSAATLGVVGATLPPHPKQKSLPPPALGGLSQTTSAAAPIASDGLRSLSSTTNSSLHLRNAWEDKFFSTLMMTDGASRAASLASLAANGATAAGAGAGGGVPGLAALVAAQQQMQMQGGGGLAQHRRAGSGKGGGAGPSLKRQTTAEILLEAAGELGNGPGGKSKKE